MPYLKIEEKLLIYCLRAHFNQNSNNEEIIKTILENKIDWDYFISRSSYNKVLSLVWWTLNEVGLEYIPKTVAYNLQSNFNKTTNQNQSKIIELKRLLILFKENNIPLIPIKGAMLAVYYNDISLRQWFDIDIIIYKQDFNKAYDLLVSHGYKPKLQHDEIQLSEFLNTNHSYHFINEKGIAEVDLHWSLEDEKDNGGIHFPIQQIWENHVKQTHFDIEIPMLNPNDLILTTCIHHGLRTHWYTLRLIFDFAIILNHFKKLNWNEIISSAEKLKIKNTLLAGAFLAEKLLEINLPPEIKKIISKNTSIKKIEWIVYKKLFRDCNKQEIWISNLWIKIYSQDNFYRRVEFIITKLFLRLKPNIRDKKIFYLRHTK